VIKYHYIQIEIGIAIEIELHRHQIGSMPISIAISTPIKRESLTNKQKGVST